MNRTEFIDAVAYETGMYKKDVRAVVDTGIALIVEKMKADEGIDFYGFGKFEPKIRPERNSVDPYGNPIVIPEHRIMKFRPAKVTKKEIFDI